MRGVRKRSAVSYSFSRGDLADFLARRASMPWKRRKSSQKLIDGLWISWLRKSTFTSRGLMRFKDDYRNYSREIATRDYMMQLKPP